MASSPARDVILEGRHLRKVFGGLVAVNDVSLAIERERIHSIIGPNGAGKTTLMNLISGIYKPTAGTVIYRGQDITHAPLHARAHLGIGRSFQITNIFPNLSVLENVRLAVQALSSVSMTFWRRADSYREFLGKAMQAIELVGLRDVMLQPALALPHGGKRKLEIAILLAGDPELLLLDEPTAGVAAEQVDEIIHIIGEIRRQGRKTVVIVEHNMSLVMNVSDHITVMHLGDVLAEGAPGEIAANQIVQKAYLGELYSDVMHTATGESHDAVRPA
ncbi:MAG: ABC transporter ATP-binding protein [Anaerolineae bacterium]|nr:ABC transporter ATP-binding protein [Anaerolineae bacterium]